ncbi:MAG: hypothetical protein HW419_4470, partial [Deltaproteobacteria bacterium]|nr:hypothetical protein [Deltaproteobacteria bacterium]
MFGLEFMKAITAKHKNADGIYMLGSAWKSIEIIERLENDTGLTVVHAGPARVAAEHFFPRALWDFVFVHVIDRFPNI